MNFLQFYQAYQMIFHIVTTFLGGGLIVQFFHWLKCKWQREEEVDNSIKNLGNTSKELKEAIENNKEQINRIEKLAEDAIAQQESLEIEIEQLQEYKNDTKDNTKAILELSHQIEMLIEKLDKNGNYNLIDKD